MLFRSPFWAARGRVALPVDLLEGWSASGSQLLSDEGAPIRRATAKHLLDVAARYFSQAESRPFPRRAMAAILPMAETGKSLRRLAAVNFDPVTDAFAVPRVARQAAMLRAYVLGHL